MPLNPIQSEITTSIVGFIWNFFVNVAVQKLELDARSVIEKFQRRVVVKRRPNHSAAINLKTLHKSLTTITLTYKSKQLYAQLNTFNYAAVMMKHWSNLTAIIGFDRFSEFP